ncbi:MAG: AAA family ATPase [Elusimicrobiota bacterium]
MFTRILKKPEDSILLVGPRGTGKSTWIREHFKDAVTYDLLDSSEALRFARDPSLLYKEVSILPAGSWVVVDEVQKAPALLDEVHRLIEQRGLRFILSGSSARKLRRGGTNLLAGRALLTPFFPLVSQEVGFDLPDMRQLRYGMLPKAFLSDRPQGYLRTYASTYLKEEIQAEALTRSIGAFSRFLEVASRQNGQITNVSNIARDAQVPRPTVACYFEILADTLIGSWLPAWKLKRATKQARHPKFYFFDPGIGRALSERLPYPPTEEESGVLLETWILNELRAYLSYSGLDYPIYYWSSPDRVEVDFFLETARGYLALEAKSAPAWRSAFGRGLQRLRSEMGGGSVRCLGVYGGARKADFNGITIMPWLDFLKELWSGGIVT